MFGELTLGVVGPCGAFAVGGNEFTHAPGGGVVHMGGLAQGVGVAGGAAEPIVGEGFGVAQGIGMGALLALGVVVELVTMAFGIGDFDGPVVLVIGEGGGMTFAVGMGDEVAALVPGVVFGAAVCGGGAQ